MQTDFSIAFDNLDANEKQAVIGLFKFLEDRALKRDGIEAEAELREAFIKNFLELKDR